MPRWPRWPTQAMTRQVPRGRRVEVVIGRGNYFNRGNLIRLQHGRIDCPDRRPAGSRSIRNGRTRRSRILRQDLKESLPPFEAATIPGQLTNATAGRVADRLDLGGASYVVDAASASSLVALDLGRRALLERRADLALVGGCTSRPTWTSRSSSASSTCFRARAARPFAVDADGMIPGEGVGVVVLKRLRDAERAGDRIYAVRQGRRVWPATVEGRGLASPSSKGHARAIRRAYRGAGIDPATVGLIEGHGLGVPAADRAELRALSRCSCPHEVARRVLGAVSSQIGHAMPAAGMAGLIKAALALHHRVLPPTLACGSAAPAARRKRPGAVAHGPTLDPRRFNESPPRRGQRLWFRRDQRPCRARGACSLGRRNDARGASRLGHRGDSARGRRSRGPCRPAEMAARPPEGRDTSFAQGPCVHGQHGKPGAVRSGQARHRRQVACRTQCTSGSD